MGSASFSAAFHYICVFMLLLYYYIICVSSSWGLRHSAPHPAIYASACHYYYTTICALAY